jgi:excisionase family DNA binding protein
VVKGDAVNARPSASDLRARLEAVLAPEVVRALEQLVAETVRAELAEQATANVGRRWLTLREAGEQLGCSPDAVRMRVKRGRLVAERQGSRLYVSAASVDALG